MPPLPRTSTTRPFARGARLIAAVAGVLVLSACGGGAGPEWPSENLVTLALESAPLSLDPRVATDSGAGRVFELMMGGLVSKDTRGNLIPDVAESWEILDDGRRYRFHLRDGLTFHDGRPLAARDVKWTFDGILDGTVVTSKRASLAQVTEIRLIDESTVDFELSEPFGALLVNLTPFLGIVPHGMSVDEFNAAPVGTGPFRLVERAPDRVVLDAFDGYWGGRPKLDRVILREIPDATVRALELRKGSVQLAINVLTPDIVPAFREDAAFRVVEDPGSNYQYLGFNLEDPMLGRTAVRQAIAHALDREVLIESLIQNLGIRTETMMPPGHWARNDDLELIPHDPEAARQLLDGAGLPDPDGAGPEPRFGITYKTSTDETMLLQAQIIQAMLAEVGIEVTIRSYEFATFYNDIKQGNFQMYSLRWMGVVDPDIYKLVLHSASVPPNGANRGRYSNPRFDALIEEGARYAEPERRRPPYVEAQAILAEDLPYVSLYTKVNVAVMAAELEGYENYLSGELHSLKRMHWNRRAD